MEQNLSLLVALVLVSVCNGEVWTPPDYCNDQICPQFLLIDSNQDFEVRSYVPTDWITTEVASSAPSDLFAANTRLRDYCDRQSKAGYNIPTDTWPVLINSTGSSLFMSWFVPPGTQKPENTDPSVILQSIPEMTYYVRIFSGNPSLQSGSDNRGILRDALIEAGRTFNQNNYIGAGYDSLTSVTHHNEIWIPATL